MKDNEVVILGDRERIDQVIDRVLSGAPEGKTSLEIELTAMGDKSIQVILAQKFGDKWQVGAVGGWSEKAGVKVAGRIKASW